MLPQRSFELDTNQREREMLLARQIMGWLVWTAVCRVYTSSGRNWREPPHNVSFAEQNVGHEERRRGIGLNWRVLVLRDLFVPAPWKVELPFGKDPLDEEFGAVDPGILVILLHVVKDRNQWFPAKVLRLRADSII
jgi:hypothetical protein